MWLSNEVLAGVLQRSSTGQRRAAECVSQRLAAVTRVHGSIHRHELQVVLRPPRALVSFGDDGDAEEGDESDASPDNFTLAVSGLPVELAHARAACRAVMQRQRVTELRFLSQDVKWEYADVRYAEKSFTRLAHALAGVLSVVCEGGERVRLRALSFALDADMELLFGGDAVANVARLVEQHASTIDDFEMRFEGDETSFGAIFKALSACAAMQRFSVRLGDMSTNEVDEAAEVLRLCISNYSHLRALTVDSGELQLEAAVIFDSLVNPSLLQQLSLTHFDVEFGHSKADGMLASLRRLDLRGGVHFISQLLPRLADACPLLEELHDDDGDDVEWSAVAQLVRCFFGKADARRLRVELPVQTDDDAADALWPAACAAQAVGWRADVADLQLECSDADVCGQLGIEVAAALAQQHANKDAVVVQLTRGDEESKRELLLLLREHDDYDGMLSDDFDDYDYDLDDDFHGWDSSSD